MMNYQTAIKAVLLAVALVLSWAWGYQTGKVKPQLAAAEAQNRATTRSIAAGEGVRTNREEKRATRRSEALRQDKEVERALQDNPDWSAARVPDSVWDSLFPGSAGSPDRVPESDAGTRSP